MVLNSIKFHWQDRPNYKQYFQRNEGGKSNTLLSIISFPVNCFRKKQQRNHYMKELWRSGFCWNCHPKNDGTNSCALIFIGIIDNVIQVNSMSFVKELHMDLSVDSIINYPQSFNSFRDTARLYDTYETYEILCSNNLLHSKFEFQEYLIKTK